MIHDQEKSDPSILAVKSTNKGGQPVAEPMERREGTEGNTVENRTCRTPSRGSVFQGLDRVREAAKAKKKERFTALLHHVDAGLLGAAFSWLKRDAAPGIHPDKTRLIEFGRFAVEDRAKRGLGKPETFNFLGFTHICGCSMEGKFHLRRKSRRDRMRTKVREIKEELRRRMHHSIPEQGKWLRQVVLGYFAYHAVPTNIKSISAFRHHIVNLWRRTLRRRSQKDHTTWARIAQIASYWLPTPSILHPWPRVRFAVKHPRWEPGA